MDSKLHLFPFSLPGELHISQAGRLHRGSGNISTSHTYGEAYDAPPFRLTQLIPTHLEKFASKVEGSLAENVKKILRENTVFPLLETFGNASLPTGTDMVSIGAHLKKMPKRLVGDSRKINLCVHCLRCDRIEHGTPYIHRAHQTPGVYVCWRHKVRLLDACPFCHCPFEPHKNLVMAPWEPCTGCKTYLPDSSFHCPEGRATEQEVELAQFTYDLLEISTQTLNAKLLTTIYLNRIAEIGMLRGKNIDRLAMLSALESHYGAGLIKQIDRAYREGKNQQWFGMCGTSSVFDVPLPRHILLAKFLFLLPPTEN